MDWLVVDENYLNYLRRIEKRIPMSDYGEDKFKPFFGILFETERYYYITQISHAQERHYKMKNNKDFKKLYHPKSKVLLAVVNLNYMFPIPKSLKNVLEYKNIDQHRTFKDDRAKSKYINLMKTELKILESLKLEDASRNIYENKYSQVDKKLADRCIDFKLMEKCANRYIECMKNEVE